MNEWAQKVFWTDVSVQKSQSGFQILLDERAIKTPLKATLEVPSQDYAKAIAAEWENLDKVIDPTQLPMTKIASASVDKVSAQPQDVIANLAEYGLTDLVSYRAERPQGLIDKQAEIWDPMIGAFADEFGVRLNVVSGVMPVAQPVNTYDVCVDILRQYTPFQLAAVHELISLSGSFVIGINVADGKIGVLDAWNASRIEEDWQIEEWGADEDAAELAKTRQNAFERAALIISFLK